MTTTYETIKKEEFELKVKVTVEGFESFSAIDKEAAIAKMQEMLDHWEPTDIPLVDVSFSFKITAKKLR